MKSANASYYPYLTASANYGWTGGDFPLNEGWAAGATLNFPIFNGFLTKYQVAEAKANLNVVNSNIEFIRQAITLDVQQAFLNLLESRQRIATAELTVRQATENLELANGRYAAGVGNPIEVTDALVNASNAQTNYNQALYDYKIAQASMDKATGVRY
jgi:outer membrane protein TolC